MSITVCMFVFPLLALLISELCWCMPQHMRWGVCVCTCVCVEDSAVYIIYVNDMYVSVCGSALCDCVCYC